MNHGRIDHRHNEPEHQLQCLARYICNLAGGLPDRRRFIARMRLSHGKRFADKLKFKVAQEWDSRHE
jgi:hypothetical protein